MVMEVDFWTNCSLLATVAPDFLTNATEVCVELVLMRNPFVPFFEDEPFLGRINCAHSANRRKWFYWHAVVS